jgi:glutaredoxin-like protein
MTIRERDKRQIQDSFRALTSPVKLAYFTQEFECDFCSETGELLRQLTELSGMLSLDVYNFQLDREQVTRFQVDKIPATVIMGAKDYGIRMYGVPAGYEFTSLVEVIGDVSRGDSGLQPATREKLAALAAPVHLQVMVTPT